MAFTLTPIAAKDGAGATVGGGLMAADVAGSGVGPFFLFQGLVDGVAGVNRAAIDSSNRLAVLASLAAGTANIGDVDILTIAAGDNNIGNVDIVTLPALVAGTANIGDVDVLTVNGVAPAFGTGARGATVQRVTIATDDLLPVSLASVPAHAVTNAGTFAVQPAGSVAHDGAASGVNPTLVGGYANAAAPADVGTDVDSVRAWFLRNGAQAINITAAGVLIPGDATNGLDVDVTRLIPGTSATHLGKAIGNAAGTTDTGVAILAVRDDALSTLSDPETDYVPLRVNSTGGLHVTMDTAQLTTLLTSQGAFAAGAQQVSLPSDHPAIPIKTNGCAFTVSVIPTITAGAYSAHDILGGEMTITAAARVSGGGGVIQGVSCSFEGDIAASAIEVLIFRSNPAGTYTDNAALNISDADTYLLLDSWLLDVKCDTGDGSFLKSTKGPVSYVCSGSADLYALAVNRTGATPDATDAAQFNFHLLRD